MDQFSNLKNCTLIGAPAQSGTRVNGCLMGPDAFRTAGLGDMLQELGHTVFDIGNLQLPLRKPMEHSNTAIHGLAETHGWIDLIANATYEAVKKSDLPIILGGDHSISAGSIPAIARHAADMNQPLFVLWLDAHPDIHLLDTTQSGNLHGTPVAYVVGCEGFAPHYPPLMGHVQPENICMMGLRSVDQPERQLINELGIETHDMRAIDEHGIKAPLTRFLDRVAKANGRLHVSLDVDFLDPDIACAVGTTVPGGATFREAHLVMELLNDSDLVTSLDLVELNPFLDEQGKTSKLLADLCASLMGRRVLDRQTRSY